MRKYLIVALVVVVVAVVVFASLKSSAPKGKKVETEAVTPRTIASRVKASGEITPEKKVEISAKVTGEIVALPVQEGDSVHHGQVLVQIEDDLYRAARDQAAAALRQAQVSVQRAEIQLGDSKRTLKRTQELFDQGLASEQQMDDADVGFKSAEVDLKVQRHAVEQYQSSLKRAQDDLARTIIRSPMDGMVIQLNAERGETVVPGTTNLPGSVIMTIADMSRLLAEVEVGEVDVVDLALGQPTEVRVDALGDEAQEGDVVEIATSGRKDAAQGIIRFNVKVAIHDPDPRLRPAMTAKVNIVTAKHEDVLCVPIQSVVKRRLDDQGKELSRRLKKGGVESDVVYVVRDGIAHSVQVKTGISDDLWVEILSGLEKGDEVISGPYKTLKTLHDGDEVTPGHEEVPTEEEDDSKVEVEVG